MFEKNNNFNPNTHDLKTALSNASRELSAPITIEIRVSQAAVGSSNVAITAKSTDEDNDSITKVCRVDNNEQLNEAIASCVEDVLANSGVHLVNTHCPHCDSNLSYIPVERQPNIRACPECGYDFTAQR